MKRLISGILLCGILFAGLSLFAFAENTTTVVAPHEYYESYEEFASAVKSKKVRAFVPYPYIESLGELAGITLWDVGSNCSYEYLITDENGFQFSLKITEEDRAPSHPSQSTGLLPANETEDLRYSNLNDGMHTVQVGNAGYIYKTKLYWIMFWLSDDPESPYYNCQAWITASSALSDYPVDGKDTLFSLLLKKETAADAIEDIRDMSTGKTARLKMVTVYTTIGVTLVATVITVSCMIIYRKKKKKAADGVKNEGKSPAGNDPDAPDGTATPDAPTPPPETPT